MIEQYFHNSEGYNPFLIRKGWQVAQLNYLPEHGFDDLIDVEAHHATDEVFILMSGKAILITATVTDGVVGFELQIMKQGVTYNVPAGVWHNIAMDKDAQCIIVENDNTHLCDVEHYPLSDTSRKQLYDMIARAIGQ